ncbi:hypothetical protein C9374_011833 [Naegleria lovaniensis]|uniref:Uncharacterized protein n=1 Tax=Naegleria lovaniensis TaxID=51637 RepID=A0AA88KEJ2_NAELO|nr:uncharacterized protein C9374_011833 [Naegleria lovaniensis]KAG2373744.1 hypothetical protein C9374_011833 [Naegleria lovaniensis]
MGNFFATHVPNINTLDLNNENHFNVLDFLAKTLHDLYVEYQSQLQQYAKNSIHKPVYIDLFSIPLPKEMIIRFETTLTRDQLELDPEKKYNPAVEFQDILSFLTHLENADKCTKTILELRSFLQSNKRFLTTSHSKNSMGLVGVNNDITRNLNAFEDTIKDLIDENTKSKDSSSDLYNRLQLNNFLIQLEIHLFSKFSLFLKRKAEKSYSRNATMSRLRTPESGRSMSLCRQGPPAFLLEKQDSPPDSPSQKFFDSSPSSSTFSPSFFTPDNMPERRRRSFTVSTRQKPFENLEATETVVSPFQQPVVATPSSTISPPVTKNSSKENVPVTSKPLVVKKKKKKEQDPFTYSFLLTQKGYVTDQRFKKKVVTPRSIAKESEKEILITKIYDSSDEEERIAVTLPKNHEVSPLVAKINKMIKVIRQNLPEIEYKENDKNLIPLVREDPNSLRNIILAISFFEDLDLNDVSNQYAIVECGGIPTLIKLFDHHGDDRIRIGSANILAHLSRNSRIQLSIAENMPALLRCLNSNQPAEELASMTHLQKTHHKLKFNKTSQITFLSLLTEVIANCCERIAVRRIIKKTKGIKKVLLFLLNNIGFFDGSGHAGVNIFDYFRVKGSSQNRPFSLAAQNLQNNKTPEALSIIHNCLRIIWSTSKSKSNQEDICNTKLSGMSGISILDKYLDQLYFYLKDFGSEADETVIGPHKILVPVIGSFMHCAENDAIRVQLRNNDLVKKLLVVLTSINNIMVKTNVFHIELLIVMSGLLFNLTIEKHVREQINTILEIMALWIKKYEKQARADPERSLILLEYITGAMFNASYSMENAQKIFELGLIPSLTSFLDINFVPKRAKQQPTNTSLNASLASKSPTSPTSVLSPSKRRRRADITDQEEVFIDASYTSGLLKTKSVEKSDELIKFRCAGIIANCARLPWTKLLIFKSGIVDYISPLLVSSSKTDLIAHCLDILGQICNCSSVLDSMLKQGAMKAIWSMVRNEKPEIQAAAARAISNCIHNAEIAARIGETYVSGIGVLVRVLESSSDIYVLGNICLAIAKMSQNPMNRAIFTEEGACTHIANMLRTTQKWMDDLMAALSTKPKANEFSIVVYETETGEKKKLVYDNPVLNSRLNDNLFLRSTAALAIAELGKHAHNSITFFEQGVVDPLIENIKLQRMLQKHYDSNHRKHYENTAMIDIISNTSGKSTMTQENGSPSLPPIPKEFSRHQHHHGSNSSLSHHVSADSKMEQTRKLQHKKPSPFVCHSIVCAPYMKLENSLMNIAGMLESENLSKGHNSSSDNISSDEKEETEEIYEEIPMMVAPSDIDCHYHHIFRNTSYALSVLSENEIISKTLRICNTVHLLVRLLSAKNDALQLSAANAIANVRKFHVCSKTATSHKE